MNAQLEETAVTVREPEQLTAKEVRAQVNLVQEVMKAVMQKGTHYGTIPGCGDKPTLLKPGAEKLASTFRLAINPEVEDLSTKDVVKFRIRAMITHQVTGQFLGAGVGECSGSEEKYYWRNAVCDEEYNDTPEDRRRIKYRKSYDKITKLKQVRTNQADVANTVLKICKKRALVDGILTVTGASDIFTQDIEDLPEELLEKKPQKPPQPPPDRESGDEPPPEYGNHAQTDTAQPEAPQGDFISDKQRKRLYAIAMQHTNKDVFEAELRKMGYTSSTLIPKSQYEDIVSFFEAM